MEPNQNQTVNPSAMPEDTQGKKSLGPVIGIIVVVILLVIGAFYVWGNKLSNTEESASTPVESSAVVPPSDEVSDIEAELNSAGEIEIDLSELDAQ